jgi:ATP-dependent RNA helicase DDX3X
MSWGTEGNNNSNSGRNTQPTSMDLSGGWGAQTVDNAPEPGELTGWDATPVNSGEARSWSIPEVKANSSVSKSGTGGWNAPTSAPVQAPSNTKWDALSNPQTTVSWDAPSSSPAQASSNSTWDAPSQAQTSGSTWDAPLAAPAEGSSWDAPSQAQTSGSTWDAPSARQTSNSSWDNSAPSQNKNSWNSSKDQDSAMAWESTVQTQNRSSWENPNPPTFNWNNESKAKESGGWDSNVENKPSMYEDSRFSRYQGNGGDSNNGQRRQGQYSNRNENQNNRSYQNNSEPDPTRIKREYTESELISAPCKAFATRSSEYTEERDQELESELFSKEATVNMGINFAKYDAIPVSVSGTDIPPPISSFEKLSLHPSMLENIRLAKYVTPTPVQKVGIPILLNERDLMVCAQTGSGKTAAFLTPIISLCVTKNIKPIVDNDSVRKQVCPVILVLAPTRELATQIFDEARKFTYRLGVRPCLIYGGVSTRDQMNDLRQGCSLLVATTGRLVDFIDRGIVSLKGVRFLVLDEADRMLDMGFERDIRRIADECTPKTHRQTLLFSATFPDEIKRLGSDFLKLDHVYVEIGVVGAACDNITQEIRQVSQRGKREELRKLLSEVGKRRIIIFVETKREADSLDDYLFRQGFPCASIHGDRTQQEREAVLLAFKRGQTPIMIATNVAARGLDIPDVKLVVIYDFPKNIDDYIHRIGRTARAGNIGKAVTFFTYDNEPMKEPLVAVLKSSNQQIPEFLLSRGGGGDGYRGGNKEGGW